MCLAMHIVTVQGQETLCLQLCTAAHRFSTYLPTLAGLVVVKRLSCPTSGLSSCN